MVSARKFYDESQRHQDRGDTRQNRLWDAPVMFAEWSRVRNST